MTTPFRSLGVIVLAVVLVGQIPPVCAQEPKDEPKTPEVDATLTAAEVQSRLSSIERAGDVAEEVKVEAQNLYNQAIQLLDQAEKWRLKAEDYRKGRAEAPTLLKSLKDSLTEPATPDQKSKPPDTVSELTLEQVTQQASNAEADLKTRQQDVAKLDEELKQRADRRVAIPDLLAAATTKFETANRGLSDTTALQATPQLQLARKTLLTAQRIAAQAEITACQEELQFYDARNEVLAARRDLARSKLSAAETVAGRWRKLATDKRADEAERQRKQAARELAGTSSEIKAVAEDNNQLATKWKSLSGRISSTEKETKSIRDLSAATADQLTKLKDYAKPGMTDLLGPLIRRQRSELRALSGYKRQIERNSAEFASVQLDVLEVDNEIDELVDLDRAVDGILAELPEDQRANENLAAEVRTLLTTRQDILKKLRSDYNTYTSDLIEQKGELLQLDAKAQQLDNFMKERVLWIPSAAPVYRMSAPKDIEKIAPAANVVVKALLVDADRSLPLYIACVLLILIILGTNPFARRDLKAVSQLVLKPLTDRYTHTFRVLVDTLVVSIPLPVILLIIGWRLSAIDVSSDEAAFGLAEALSVSLWWGSLLLFGLLFAQHVCQSKGLGASHFRWDVQGLRAVRPHFYWFIPVAVSLTIVVVGCELMLDPGWSASLGRLSFITLMLATTAFLRKVFQPARGGLSFFYRRKQGSAFARSRWLIYCAATLVPFICAVLSAVGYHYTALTLSVGLAQTIAFSFLLVLLHAMAVRGVFYAQRQLAVEQARRKREEAEATTEDGKSAEPPDLVLSDTDLNIGAIGVQTRKLLTNFLWFGALVVIWLSWSNLLPALSFLNDVSLWKTTSQVPATDGSGALEAVTTAITLANFLSALIILVLTFALARNLPGVLEIVFLRRLVAENAARFAIITIARYVITVGGLVLAFNTIGIGWSKVQWLVAAVTVGLGFGLQEIFANFVSGLILLFERPIRIGDTVTVGSITGTVTRMQIRATTICDWDRKELVIPNKEFVTGQFVNWSLTDSIIRTVVPVGIAYGSDVHRAKQILTELANNCESVLDQPKPRVWFCGFGASSLDFEVRVFVKDIEDYLVTRDSLHFAIDAAFREAGIEIAFPQRDIHVRSIDQALFLTSKDGQPMRALEPAAESIPQVSD